MKQKSISSRLTRWFLILFFMALPTTALADSPWFWQMSLKIDKRGDSMYMPSAVAFDLESERYYVVDTGRSRLVSFGRDGKFVRAFTANNQLKSPFDMVRLKNGQLWVVEKGRNSLTLIDVAAKKIEHKTLKDGDRLIFPHRIGFAKGKLYVLDRSGGQVMRLAGDLSIEQRFGCSDCSAGFVDFAIEGDTVLALEPRDKKVIRFRADGTISDVIKLGDKVDFPVSLATGPSGYLYVLDRRQNSVLAYDEGGVFRYSFLGSGQAPGTLYFPSELRFDPWGRLCVVDEGNGRVEIFSR
jgi:sugar lactone lactonase YvrE